MLTSPQPPSAYFLKDVGLTQEEFAELRGMSRNHAVRTLEKFLENPRELTKLWRKLLVTGNDRDRVTAEKLKRFAAEELGVALPVATGAAVINVKSYAELFAENRELWIWATSPLDVEHAEYWESLCSEFLDHEGRLLVYFVPRLEVADQLALRFETELRSRFYDGDGCELENAKGFGATIFIIVTNLAAMVPYAIVANPGSANLRREGMVSSGWGMGDKTQDLYELPSRFNNQLMQQVRKAGLGLARIPENFFPMGEALKGESGVPFKNYPYLDHLIAIVHETSIGLFDGKPIEVDIEGSGKALPKEKVGDHAATKTGDEDEFAEHPTVHPLKLYPIFIRAYRKKAGDMPTKLKRPTTKKALSSFFRSPRVS